jgi:hypothetical protein
MTIRAGSATPVHTPHTKALLAFEENLDSIMHMLKLANHQIVLMRAQAAHASRVAATLPKKGDDLTAKPGQAKLVRSVNRLTRSLKTLEATIDGLHTITLWQVVMLVTCVEAYLQDVLAAAASVDPELMSKSEQTALYADVVTATSLEALSNDLRARWARGWVNDGGPTRWIDRRGKMGRQDIQTTLGAA